MKRLLLSLAAAAAFIAPAAHAANDYDVYITEWMYKGVGPDDGLGEFIEFTNFGTTAVDFTGWSFDDDSRLPLVKRLTEFGLVAAGESVILTEIDANEFRTRWGLDASVKVIGGYSNNLGNGDEINLFDANQQLVDRLTYGTSPRTLGRTGHAVSSDVFGTNQASKWVLSTVGDLETAVIPAFAGATASSATGRPAPPRLRPPAPARRPAPSPTGCPGGPPPRRRRRRPRRWPPGSP